MLTEPTRSYGLDALRGSMMLLGILFHLAIPYTGVLFPGNYVTHVISPALQIVLILHYFRMPTFFLLSGFFSALLWGSKGPYEFLRTRAKRVGLVWLAALAILSPVMVIVSIYNHFASEGGPALMSTWGAITSLQIDPSWLQQAPLHLWFLEYLMLFCIAAAALLSMTQTILPVLDRWTGNVILSRFRIVLLALPTAAALTPMPLAVIPYPSSFVPWLGISFAYGWFYAVGWLIYRRRDLLPSLAINARAEKVAMPVLFLIALVLAHRRTKVGLYTDAPVFDIAIASFTALSIWSTIIVLISSFSSVKARTWLPYVADSSYWIYLMHYPLASLIPGLLRHWSVSPVIKVALSTAFVFFLGLVTYDLFVRYSIIGRALNGVRVRAPAWGGRATTATS